MTNQPDTAYYPVALYARTSYDDRGNELRNLQGQLDICRAYAESQGWRVVGEYPEDERGATGVDINLPQLRKVVELAREGIIRGMVVRDVSRFSRDLYKFLDVTRELRSYGAEVHFAQYQFDESPQGELMRNFMALLADFDRTDIVRRLMRGREQKIAAGYVIVNKMPPLGYLEEEGRLIIDEEQAQIVRNIYDWYIDKGWGVRQIADHLTELGVPTYRDRIDNQRLCNIKSQPRGQWSTSSIHRILKNETYAGLWRSNLGCAEVPAIVERETWNRVAPIMRGNRNFAKRNTRNEYLLRRLVVCGRCGLHLGASHRSQGDYVYLYYYCPARGVTHTYAKECDQHLIRADHLDALVWEWVQDGPGDPGNFNNLVSEALEDRGNDDDRQAEIGMLERELDNLQQRMTRLIDLYVDEAFDHKELARRRDGYRQQIAEINLKLATLRSGDDYRLAELSELEQVIDNLRLGIVAAEDDFDLRRKIVEALDLRVTIDGVDISRRRKRWRVSIELASGAIAEELELVY